MLLRSKYKSGTFIWQGREYQINDSRIDVSNKIAMKMILSGDYAPFCKFPELDDNCKKVMMIRGSGLGDIMFTHPLRKKIKSIYKNIERFDFLTSPEYHGLTYGDKTIDNVVTMNDLGKTNYDYIVNLNQLEFHSSFSEFHKIDLFAVRCRIPPVENKTLFYKIKPEEIEWAKTKITDKNALAVVIRSTCNTKHFKIKRLVEILNNLKGRYTILLFDKSRMYGRKISESIKNSKVINCCGKFNVRECAALINECVGMFTPDTGFLHIGIALGKNVVAYFGSIGHELVLTPGKGEMTKIYNSLDCYPCNRFDCMKGSTACLRHDPKSVAKIILKKIGV